ncbi:Rpn family recombination-promoting nuclease/putative transposase [Candidatus Stoquefichus massiliensis]|uniref:Rpn family recombination-promoting nuclease/putative transposase n=1 Tax=Candidatus Stoquefichus massiliensis TaxID=1470350 RepID=UPI0004B19616|nr:Rpn family recombination-promoting nuclease/putative transposase [Candidatus Stoquefichus massiliensis]
MNQLIDTKPAATFADYLKDKSRFADLINYFLFDGKPVLDESHFYDYDSDSSTVFNTKNEILSVGKSRDIIMAVDINNYTVLIGIEHQQAIDYTMPYRIMMYDLIGYNQQYNRLDKNKKKSFQPTPIITFVLYSGERKWNRPRTFAEQVEVPEWLIEKFNDWIIHVFDIKDIDVSKLHHPDNIKLVEAIQKIYQWNGDIRCLKDMVMSKEVAILVATIVNQKELLGIIENEDKEEIDMCTSITQALMQRELKGKTTMLTTILKARFGTLPCKTEERLKECTDEQLDLLAVHMFDIHSKEDIIKLI